MGADLRRHAAGDFRHWHEKRQRALLGGYSFVSDRSDPTRHQLLGLRAIRREMQIGEQHLPARQFFALRGEWLLYLHDQFGAIEYSVAIRYDLGPSTFIVAISESCPCPCLPLDQNLVPILGELTHSRGHNTDAVFVVFDLPWHTDQHGTSRRLTCRPRQRPRYRLKASTSGLSQACYLKQNWSGGLGLMSALDFGRALRRVGAMSALPPKADIANHPCDVCFVPEADSCGAAKKSCAGLYMRAMAIFEVMVALTSPSLRNGHAASRVENGFSRSFPANAKTQNRVPLSWHWQRTGHSAVDSRIRFEQPVANMRTFHEPFDRFHCPHRPHPAGVSFRAGRIQQAVRRHGRGCRNHVQPRHTVSQYPGLGGGGGRAGHRVVPDRRSIGARGSASSGCLHAGARSSLSRLLARPGGRGPLPSHHPPPPPPP